MTTEILDGDLPPAGRPIQSTDRLMGFDSTSDTYFFTPDEIAAGLNLAAYLLAANNLSDVDNIGVAKTNLGLSPSDSVTFAAVQALLYRAIVNQSGDTLVLRFQNNGAGGVVQDFVGVTTSSSTVEYAFLTAHMTDNTSTLVSSELYWTILKSGSAFQAMTLRGDGLWNTALNYDDPTILLNTQDNLGITGKLTAANNLSDLTSVGDALLQLGLSPADTPEFSQLQIISGLPAISILNSAAFNTALSEILIFFQRDSGDAFQTTAQFVASATNVTAGSFTGKLQIGITKNNITVPDAATITGDGLVDTQLNFTNQTKIDNSLIALQLGIGDTPQFANLFLAAPGSTTLKLYDTQSPSLSANSNIYFGQSNDASAIFDSVIVKGSSTDITAGNESSKLQVGVIKSGSFIADAVTVTGDGLVDTQLNFTNQTKIDNSLAALQLGSADTPQFANLFLVAPGQPTLKLYDTQPFTTSANGKWEFIQYNSASAFYNSMIFEAYSTSVTSGNESSQAQMGFMLNGSFVPNAVTMTGNGLQDTILNYSNSTLQTTQTNLQIIGTESVPTLNVYLPPVNQAALYTDPVVQSNGVCDAGWSYSQSALNYLYFTVALPKRWNHGTFTLVLYWKTTGTTGNVVWSVDATLRNNGSIINQTFGTAVTLTSAAQGTANALTETALTTALTAGGASAANNSLAQFRIYRNGGVGSDTLAAPAILLGWQLYFTSNAGNDA